MGVARYGANDLYATKTVYIRSVYEGDIDIARLSMLANVANRGVGYNLVVGAVRAALTGDFLAGFACVITGGSVNANGGKGLCCIVACGNRVVANADGVLSGGNVLKRYVGKARAFLGNHDQIILEQVYAGSLVNIALLDGGIHGALGCRNQKIGIGSCAEHLVQLAGSLVLGVGEGYVAMAIFDISLLGFFHCF